MILHDAKRKTSKDRYSINSDYLLIAKPCIVLQFQLMTSSLHIGIF